MVRTQPPPPPELRGRARRSLPLEPDEAPWGVTRGAVDAAGVLRGDGLAAGCDDGVRVVDGVPRRTADRSESAPGT